VKTVIVIAPEVLDKCRLCGARYRHFVGALSFAVCPCHVAFYADDPPHHVLRTDPQIVVQA